MADKAFAVILSAKTSAYESAMKSAGAATSDFTGKSGRNMEELGAKVQGIGKKMSLGLTLPLVAAGGAAINASMNFETSFTRMVGLAGVTAGEVDGLKESVLGLAGRTAQAPQALADALYDASSSGLSTADAMSAVEVAAKAAAVGMGSAKSVVGLVASATASYGAENITAARATDILTGAIRAGRADPEELAGTLGRILPVAAQLGVSFEEVGGATAYLSNVFGDTNRTVTAMSGLLSKLVSPSQQGRQALADMGTSAAELQTAIDNNGLMGALDLLREKGFAGNQQALRALFDDIEGYQGALALLNDNSGTLASTMEQVAGSTGMLDEAFKGASETAGFKMKQAWADLQVALIQAGDVIMPVVSGITGAIADLASGFSNLPPAAQAVIVGFLGIVAAAGPITTIAGKVISNVQDIQKAWSAMSAFILANPMVAVVAGLAAAIAVVSISLANQESSTERAARKAREFYAAIKESVTGLDMQQVAFLSTADAAREYEDATYAGADKKLRDTITSSENFVRIMTKLGITLDDVSNLSRGGAQATETLGKVHAYLATQLGTEMVSAGMLLGVMQDQVHASYDSAEAAAALVRVGDDQAYMYLKTTDQLGLLTESERIVAEAHLDAAAATEAGTDANVLASQAVNDLGLALDPLGTKSTAAGDASEELAGHLGSVEEQAQAAKDAEKEAADNLDLLKKALDAALSPFEVLTNAAGAFTKAMDDVMGGQRGVTETQQALIAGQQEMTKTVNEHKEALDKDKTALDDSATSLDVLTETGRGNRDMIASQTDKILASTEAMIRNGASNQEAAGYMNTATDSLKTQLAQLGFTKDEVDAYVAALGLTPENVTTAIELINNEIAKKELGDRLDQLEGIDKGAAAEIQALIDEGDFAEAQRRLDILDAPRVVKLFVDTIARGDRGGVNLPTATGGFFPGGTNQLRTVAETAGSSGDEAVLTLGNQARLQALLKDPRIGQPIAAAMPNRAPQVVEITRDRAPVSVSFGDIINAVDMTAALQQVQFAMAAAS